jgi:predicted dehydrogenase
MNQKNQIGIAVIGYGYWGPNLARNVQDSSETELLYVCDLSEDLHQLVRKRHPYSKATKSIDEVVGDEKVDAVLLATPPHTHCELALKALRAGKNVMVEKPFAETSADGQKMLAEARAQDLVLMVDHTFPYTGAVRKLKTLTASGELGELFYYDSVRINLGLFQRDVNVLWDLAVHDLAILDHLTEIRPTAVSATGLAHIQDYPVNTAYLSLFYEENFIAHIHCSWMAPVKIRRTLLGGSKKMIVYDDLEPSEKIKLYDKGITLSPSREEKHDMRVGYRKSDVLSPKVEESEALSVLIKEFTQCIKTGSKPLTDDTSGLRVIKILEAADESMRRKGAPVEIDMEKS